MKIIEDFDRKHRNYHFWYLVILASVSGLMLIAGFFESSPSGLPKSLRVSLASVSLLASTASYLAIDRFRYSFPLVGFSTVAYAISLWAFGLPALIVLMLVVAAAVFLALSMVLKDAEKEPASSD